MVFTNVYEMITPPHVIKKSWFVDYFDGLQAKLYWNFTNIIGSGSSIIETGIDAGLRIQTGATDDNESGINFSDIRHYSQTGCVAHIVSDRDTGTRSRGGFSENVDMTNSFAFVENDPDDTFYQIVSDDGTTETTTDTSIVDDILVHRHKLELTSANIQLTMDGILESTKTTNRPDQPQQPFYAVKARAAGSHVGHIRYYEAYNT